VVNNADSNSGASSSSSGLPNPTGQKRKEEGRAAADEVGEGGTKREKKLMAMIWDMLEAGEIMQIESMKLKEEKWKELGEIIYDIHLNDLREEDPEELEGWDDVSGKKLDAKKMQEAREEEIEFFRKHGVCKRVPKGASLKVTGKRPMKTRWIDINEGDELVPNYRSRLAAKEINICKTTEMFAATPPLESIKLILSIAASGNVRSKDSDEFNGERRAEGLLLCTQQEESFHRDSGRRLSRRR
jgi:hypothetical protein